MKRPLRVFVSAGEASGDQILGAVLARLRAGHPDLELAGLGGPRAEAQGLKPLFPIARTAFSGVWDVLARAPFALRIHGSARACLRSFRPDAALLVDYPGLNLRLAREARGLGVPVHFIAPPQAWAYRDPARKLRRARVALAGCSVQPLYPIEAADWEVPGIAARAGHFLPALAPAGTKRGPFLLCPGSRLPVLRRNLPAWLRLLAGTGLSQAAWAILVPPFLESEAREIARRRGWPGLGILTDPRAAAEAPRALAFPGTFTLELARHRVPTLVLALIDPLTYALGSKLLASRRLALPNLLLGEDLFPEWAGPPPGPAPAVFRALWESLPWAGEIDWERKLGDLDAKLGPGNGAEVAAEAVVSAVGED